MSKEYAFTPIRGQFPLIRTEVKGGQRYIQLTCDGYATKVHRHFPDAYAEWQDHAGVVAMEDLLNETQTD
jgi:hypothetical protein